MDINRRLELEEMGMLKYIVRLYDGFWLENCDGDPGRTLVRANARVFRSFFGARVSLSKARRFRAFDDAVIEEVK